MKTDAITGTTWDTLRVISDIISIFTVASCLFLKVPQIMQLREKRTARGIYIQALLIEITAFTIMTLYNFSNDYSIKTYLEYPIILIQVFTLVYYVLKFKKMLDAPIVPILCLIYVSIVGSVLFNIFPKAWLTFLVPFCSPLSGFAKITYIYGIISNKNADAVSITTWIISVMTNVARLFTVYVDSQDYMLMGNFVISAMLSMGVLCTALYYQYDFSGTTSCQTNFRTLKPKRHTD